MTEQRQFQVGDVVMNKTCRYIGTVTVVDKPGKGQFWVQWNVGFRDYWNQSDAVIELVEAARDHEGL